MSDDHARDPSTRDSRHAYRSMSDSLDKELCTRVPFNQSGSGCAHRITVERSDRRLASSAEELIPTLSVLSWPMRFCLTSGVPHGPGGAVSATRNRCG